MMADLMDVLYSYAQDYMLRGLLDREAEYANVCHYVNRQEQALRAQLDQENRERLDNLLEERKLMSYFEGQALFRAGFRMAQELAR